MVGYSLASRYIVNLKSFVLVSSLVAILYIIVEYIIAECWKTALSSAECVHIDHEHFDDPLPFRYTNHFICSTILDMCISTRHVLPFSKNNNDKHTPYLVSVVSLWAATASFRDLLIFAQ